MRSVMHRASFSYLLRHPWQLTLSVLGICIGVAVIVAVDLANASSRKAFLLSMDAISGAATHQIIAGPAGIDEEFYVRLRTEHGYRDVAPVVEGYVATGQTSIQLLGVDLFAEQGMRTFSRSLSTDSREGAESLFRGMLTEPGAVLMSRTRAKRLDLAVGDRFDVDAGGRTHRALLAGTFGGERAAALDDLITADIATAQAWLGQQGRLSRIDVRLSGNDETSRERLERILPADARLLTAAGRTRSTAEMSAAFMTNLTAMSLLALLVGIFLIYNSVSFSVLQRRGLIGILRALGVTRRQTFAVILAEAAIVGLLAATLGVLAGIWLGEQLLVLVAQSINDFYYRVSVTSVSVTNLSIAKGIVAGIGTTLVAATIPAIEASSYRPRLAITRSTLEQRTRRLLPFVTITGLATVLAAVVLLQLSGRNLVGGLVAVFMLILGFALCMPVAVKTGTGMLTPLAARVGGTPARLAVSGISAGLSRTGVAIVALAVAVSATIGVSIMVGSFRGSVSEWLEQTLQADIYAGVENGGLAPELADDLARLQGVEAFSTSRRSWLESESGRTRILAIRMAPRSYAGIEILDADPGEVWPAFDNEDAVIVSEPYAYRNRVARGDSVTLRTEMGDREFRAVATYQSYDINANAILMSRATYDRHWSDRGIDSIGLYLDGNAGVDEVIAKVRSISRDRQRLIVNSNAGIRELSLDIFDRTFIITDVLYWLALGVAFIGILGAMLALQLERGRELAVLRALGMTPMQLAGLITGQTGVIGLLSGLAAIPLGVVMAWVLIAVINRRAFGWHIDMAVAPDVLMSAVLFSVGVALFAGIYPAWRAARSQPAMAMREE